MDNFRQDLLEALRKAKKYPIDIQPLILKHCRVGSVQNLSNEKVLEAECTKRAYLYYNTLEQLRKADWIKYYDVELREMVSSQKIPGKDDLFKEGPYNIFLTHTGHNAIKKKLSERYPFWPQLRGLLITGIISCTVSIGILQYKSQQDIRYQAPIDQRQDSVLKDLYDSLQILKRHK